MDEGSEGLHNGFIDMDGWARNIVGCGPLSSARKKRIYAYAAHADAEIKRYRDRQGFKILKKSRWVPSVSFLLLWFPSALRPALSG